MGSARERNCGPHSVPCPKAGCRDRPGSCRSAGVPHSGRCIGRSCWRHFRLPSAETGLLSRRARERRREPQRKATRPWICASVSSLLRFQNGASRADAGERAAQLFGTMGWNGRVHEMSARSCQKVALSLPSPRFKQENQRAARSGPGGFHPKSRAGREPELHGDLPGGTCGSRCLDGGEFFVLGRAVQPSDLELHRTNLRRAGEPCLGTASEHLEKATAIWGISMVADDALELPGGYRPLLHQIQEPGSPSTPSRASWNRRGREEQIVEGDPALLEQAGETTGADPWRCWRPVHRSRC